MFDKMLYSFETIIIIIISILFCYFVVKFPKYLIKRLMNSKSIQNKSGKSSPFENKSRLIGVSEQDLNNITCGICRLILEDPVLVGCCQLHYCSQCLDFWINTYNTCPNDGKRLENYGISLPMWTLIKFMDNLKVSCDYQRYGCKEELTRMGFDIHVKYCGYNTCEVCYLKKGFGTPHNCIHALKSKINYLVKENKRLTEETEKAFERSAQLNEENLELEIKLKTFTHNSKNTLAEENLMKFIDYYEQKEMEGMAKEMTLKTSGTQFKVKLNDLIEEKIGLKKEVQDLNGVYEGPVLMPQHQEDVVEEEQHSEQQGGAQGHPNLIWKCPIYGCHFSCPSTSSKAKWHAEHPD